MEIILFLQNVLYFARASFHSPKSRSWETKRLESDDFFSIYPAELDNTHVYDIFRNFTSGKTSDVGGHFP